MFEQPLRFEDDRIDEVVVVFELFDNEVVDSKGDTVGSDDTEYEQELEGVELCGEAAGQRAALRVLKVVPVLPGGLLVLQGQSEVAPVLMQGLQLL